MDKEAMITEILLAYKVSELSKKRPEGKIGDLALSLAFCDESLLRKICKDLNINPD